MKLLVKKNYAYFMCDEMIKFYSGEILTKDGDSYKTDDQRVIHESIVKSNPKHFKILSL